MLRDTRVWLVVGAVAAWWGWMPQLNTNRKDN